MLEVTHNGDDKQTHCMDVIMKMVIGISDNSLISLGFGVELIATEFFCKHVLI